MKLKKLFILSVLLFLMCNCISAQSLFKEDFNYTVLDSLDNTGGWQRFGTNFSSNIQVKTPGLNYPGYIGSGIGKTAFFSNINEGDIVNNYFTRQTSGNVYYACMIRVDSLTATATEGTNIGFDQSSGGNFANTKLYIKRISATTFKFGIDKSDSRTFSSNIYNTNTTYLAVMKYSFVNGADNDSAKMYIFTSGIPATEPAAPTAFNVTGTDILNIGAMILPNNYAQGGSLKSSSVKIDGIRVGTSWSNTLFQQNNPKLNLKALLQGFFNSSQNKMIKDTVRVYLRYKNAPYFVADSSKAVLDSLGNGSYTFTRISNLEPYYISVRHRNSIETWSYIPIQYANNLSNFDFTNLPGFAFGSNQILSGSKYCLYSGDVNQDGTVDIADAGLIDNDGFNFASGYIPTDINGDGIIDIADAVIADNNAFNFVSKIVP